MHNDTAYSLLTDGKVGVHKMVDGVRTFFESALKVIPITDPKATNRHGTLPNGEPKPYKGYKGDSNYCIEIIINEKGKWEGEVISTFEAYQIVKNYGLKALSNPTLGISGKPLVMRLMTNDCLKIKIGIEQKIVRVTKISSNGQIFLAPLNEANVDSRNRDELDPFSYISKMPGSLKTCNAIKVSISPIGILNH